LKQLIYITGSGRSGSTLLDMLLNTNPDVAALGEVHRFSMNIDSKEEAHKCTCGMPVAECRFWQDVIKKLKEKGVDPCSMQTTWSWNSQVGIDADGINIEEKIAPSSFFQRINVFNIFMAAGFGSVAVKMASFLSSFKRGKKVFEDSWLLYEAVSDVAGKNIIVDGTKSPGRLMGLAEINPKNIPVKVIYLCRDGRAVVHARMKRQGVSVSKAAKIWRLEHLKIQRALRVSGLSFIKVKYEDLCANPDLVMKSIFEFSGTNSNEMDCNFRGGSHSLGGNPMRKRTNENEIVLNEKWRKELTCKELKIFNRVAEGINEGLGYSS